MKINSLKVNRILNFLLWICFSCLSGIGLLLAFRMPPGSRGGHGLSALGLSRHEWGDLHTWLGYAFIVLIFAHLAFHWRWLWKAATKKRPSWMLVGLSLGGVLMLLIALQPVTK